MCTLLSLSLEDQSWKSRSLKWGESQGNVLERRECHRERTSDLQGVLLKWKWSSTNVLAGQGCHTTEWGAGREKSFLSQS